MTQQWNLSQRCAQYTPLTWVIHVLSMNLLLVYSGDYYSKILDWITLYCTDVYSLQLYCIILYCTILYNITVLSLVIVIEPYIFYLVYHCRGAEFIFRWLLQNNSFFFSSNHALDISVKSLDYNLLCSRYQDSHSNLSTLAKSQNW